VARAAARLRVVRHLAGRSQTRRAAARPVRRLGLEQRLRSRDRRFGAAGHPRDLRAARARPRDDRRIRTGGVDRPVHARPGARARATEAGRRARRTRGRADGRLAWPAAGGRDVGGGPGAARARRCVPARGPSDARRVRRDRGRRVDAVARAADERGQCRCGPPRRLARLEPQPGRGAGCRHALVPARDRALVLLACLADGRVGAVALARAAARASAGIAGPPSAAA
jgi:hypothetical protein